MKFKNKLIPVVVQDEKTKDILMVAYVNQEAFKKTVKTGLATFYSRSRKKIWTKGEESGNYMKIKKILIDCDMDCLVYVVEPLGPACHSGYNTCFYRVYKKGRFKIFLNKVFNPKDVYK
ncbi:MAG: phosphoribosyl-AMP cyclohydrolase [bacterium]|nr:phosphoribosyl-AMP cyclohydrolase [bacterium]